MTSSTTLGYAVKSALITMLAESYAADPATELVEVRYAAAGLPERERVHGGAVRSDQAYEYIGGKPHKTRSDTGTVEIHIVAIAAGVEVEDTDARALQLGAVLELGVASNPQLRDAAGNPRVPGLSWCGIAGLEGDYYLADDGEVGSLITYRVAYRGQLR